MIMVVVVVVMMMISLKQRAKCHVVHSPETFKFLDTKQHQVAAQHKIELILLMSIGFLTITLFINTRNVMDTLTGSPHG